MDELLKLSCVGLSELHALLHEFANIFVADKRDCAHMNIGQHQIDTGNALPIWMRPRRLSFAKRAATEEKLNEMHAAGVIETSACGHFLWCFC